MPRSNRQSLGRHSRISGESVIVTGAGGTIGNAIANRVIALGGRVVGVDRSSAGHSRIKRIGAGEQHWLQADVTEEDAIDRILDLAAETGARFIVHAAGWQLQDGRERVASETEWSSLFQVHVVAPALITARMFDVLHDRGATASCVFISSVHEETVFGDPSYGAAKGAVRNVVTELAALAADHGSRVNSVAPGHVDVQNVSSPPSRLGRRAISPDAVARAVVFLLCDHCSPFTTGATLHVDAGMRLRDPWNEPPKQKRRFRLR
ncbi:MAG TPA: SDR family oxidoreductase [Acidimicrobiia bacterium]|nr:SDR family oxidoreductase [Acidimicrobiia bacterium]